MQCSNFSSLRAYIKTLVDNHQYFQQFAKKIDDCISSVQGLHSFGIQLVFML